MRSFTIVGGLFCRQRESLPINAHHLVVLISTHFWVDDFHQITKEVLLGNLNMKSKPTVLDTCLKNLDSAIKQSSKLSHM